MKSESDTANEMWMQDAVKRKGAFKAKAKKADMSTEEFAKKVLKKGSKASKKTKAQARLAQTFAKHRPKK